MRLFHWYVIRNTALVALETERDQLRVAVQLDYQEKRELEAQLADTGRSLEHCEASLDEARKRAETAETIARGQAKHIEALQRSNETMLQSIVDMRRTGFSLPSDVLNEPDPDGISSVHDDDLQALEEHPHLAAADEF